jgi:hypothetical protein
MRMLFLSVLLCAYCTVASAVLPEQGLWWNPAEGGRGYGIEVQDNYIFVTYYGYTGTGVSAFYTSGGTYNIITNTATVFFAALSNGQCFGCVYLGDPDVEVIGNATLTFFSPMTGRIDLPNGVSIPIQRQLFFDSQPRTNLYGTWHLTTGSLGVYFGQALWIQAPNDELEGGFVGRVIDGSSARILVGSPLDDGTVAILVDSSTSYYQFYVFEWSVNRWVGYSWTYLKTSEPSGSGLQFFGSRLLGKAFSEDIGTSSLGAAPMLRGVDEDVLDSVYASQYMLESSGGSHANSAFASKRDPVDEVRLREFASVLSEKLSRLNAAGQH